MNRICVLLFLFANVVYGLKISFVSWNVKDNTKFNDYDYEIVSSLLRLPMVEKEDLPDVYAITFQENCLNCRDDHLKLLTIPFIETLKTIKSTPYKLVSIQATRNSSMCEKLHCLSRGSLHGTTLMMVLAKQELIISNIFEEKHISCGKQWFENSEKGIAFVGFSENNKSYCFGGLHLDVNFHKVRQQCIVDAIEKIKDKCDVIFLGGDFNTRPMSKDTPKPTFFEGGFNKTFFAEMKITDDLSGSEPFSGGLNLLMHIYKKTNLKFREPFNKAPDFIPTYSIDSKIKCQYHPVCYKPSKYPAWTDRIIFTPNDEIDCSDYTTIESLANLSDHIPVIANCKTF